ncbi:Cell wall channel [Corynebacterium pseudotuberculosis P54B96]|nr:Cell wall channel [Corynebacterium pseudotuberculosis PAT10]AFF22954.1 Cell wall channel [Corynebacterium pseudotuberculosis P54B96]
MVHSEPSEAGGVQPRLGGKVFHPGTPPGLLLGVHMSSELVSLSSDILGTFADFKFDKIAKAVQAVVETALEWARLNPIDKVFK